MIVEFLLLLTSAVSRAPYVLSVYTSRHLISLTGMLSESSYSDEVAGRHRNAPLLWGSDEVCLQQYIQLRVLTVACALESRLDTLIVRDLMHKKAVIVAWRTVSHRFRAGRTLENILGHCDTAEMHSVPSHESLTQTWIVDSDRCTYVLLECDLHGHTYMAFTRFEPLCCYMVKTMITSTRVKETCRRADAGVKRRPRLVRTQRWLEGRLVPASDNG
ncbi:hypothetical protein C8Q80DRAFT_190774 [Daedaleopsis nitida]|nr:hypothetical protein C8Q80DRAFT_190774 [Daedaleopsis nitida]